MNLDKNSIQLEKKRIDNEVHLTRIRQRETTSDATKASNSSKFCIWKSRLEYLGVFVQKPKRRVSNTIKVGQIVLIGINNRKRIDRPLGLIVELIPRKDKLIKVNTSQSTFLRPIQRMYPLEVDSNKDIRYPCKGLEEQQRGDNVLKPGDSRNKSIEKLSTVQTKGTGVPNISRSGSRVKIPERCNL
ncbi:hypothetical protein NPIL_444651 [Nephila pilipes]|uniref:DUF5641 domain-containing protein n=1 Tax=Nephila pilipes TaxID=299642 RepID=A0A8X6IDY9_NEPPI|nr:hypothetical protein NPIL_444651 [Nephila pilipes]